jgi:hypothetical protein
MAAHERDIMNDDEEESEVNEKKKERALGLKAADN